MRLFIQTPICTSRAHCGTCRDPGGDGPAWRAAHARKFIMPDECPHGAGMGEGWKLQVTPQPGEPRPPSSSGGGCCGG